MSHPFRDLLKHHLNRKNLSQKALAAGINDDAATITRMCKGERLTGLGARDRVVRIIEWLHHQGVLYYVEEANALLSAARMVELDVGSPTENEIFKSLKQQINEGDQGSRNGRSSARRAANTPRLKGFPIPSTSLIGRDQEVVRVCDLLRRADLRLLTLTGTGGIGKTRICVQAAIKLSNDFPDGIVFVELASINDSGLIIPAIASSLGVAEVNDQPLLESLKNYLWDKQLLLVLDNFEHVITAAALLAELLQSSAGIKLLVSSRVILHLNGEHEYPVPPLSLPDPKYPITVEVLRQCGAVELFVQRAQAVEPTFRLTSENASAISKICVQLDGLPLAIELAAARIKLYPPKIMLVRLDRRLALLTNGPRDFTTRQRTLRGTIDWSFNLLGENEQELLARLAVFVGGCTREAIEAVCITGADSSEDVLDSLEALVDYNLLRVDKRVEDDLRLTMMETIHEYAREQLVLRREIDSVRRQHAKYWLTFAAQANTELTGEQQDIWIERLEREHDNLRAALLWSRDSGEIEFALRLTGALGRFWRTRGYLSEGRQWLEWALEQWHLLADSTLAPSEQARVFESAGWLALYQGDDRRAKGLFEEGLVLSRRAGDKRSTAILLNGLGHIANSQRNCGQAIGILEEGLALFRELEDKWGIGVIANNLGLAALYQKDYRRAAELFEESLLLDQETGNKQGIAKSLNNLGIVAALQGDYARAHSLLKESVLLSWKIGDQQTTAECLEELARVAGDRGMLKQAVLLWGVAARLREVIDAPLSPANDDHCSPALAAVRDQLDDTTFTTIWAGGQAMPLEQAIAYLQEDAQ